MKRLAILGSTGSIGRSTLQVIKNFPDKLSVVGLSANTDILALHSQIKEFRPEFVCVNDSASALKLKSRLGPSGIKLFVGREGMLEMIQGQAIDEVVIAISGSSALFPLLKSISSRKTVALSNKEALVMAGSIIMAEAKRYKTKIIPIDSEESAIWQCLESQPKDRLKNIYLTASGGPFRKTDPKGLKNIPVSRVLKHPRWKMGRKISVDSATLMNKGFEFIETMHLFGVSADKIKIIVHPEAIIHSMVEFVDGVVLAQLSVTNMHIPIQYALFYPQRLPCGLPGLDFCKLKSLNFQAPDFSRFPCLKLALDVAAEGGTLPAVLNAANEVAVEEFLRKRLSFLLIPEALKRVVDCHTNKHSPVLHEILDADAWARLEAAKVIGKLRKAITVRKYA